MLDDSYPSPYPPATPVTGSDFGRILRRRWPVALLTFVAATGGALYLTAQMPRTYRAEARVLVDNPNRGALPDNLLGLLTMGNGAALETELEILRSRPVMSEVKRKTNSPLVVEDLRSQFTLGTAPGGQIVSIAAQAPTAEEAARLANTLMYVYMANSQKRRERTAEQADARLRREERLQKSAKEKAEAAVRAFMAGMGTSNPGELFNAKATQVTNLRTGLDSQRLALGTERTRLAKVTQQLRFVPRTIVTGWTNQKNPVIDEYNKKIADLIHDRAVLLENYTPESPEVQAKDADIKASEAGIRDALKNRFSTGSEGISRNGDYSNLISTQIASQTTIAAQENNIRQSEALLREREAEQKTLAVRANAYDDLIQKQATARANYQQMRKGRIDIQVRGGIAEPAVTPLESALPPRFPVSPKPLLNLLLSLFLGGFLALVTALWTEYLAMAGKRRPEETLLRELPRVAGVPVLASIPVHALPAPVGPDNNGLPAVAADGSAAALLTEDALRELGYCLTHLRAPGRANAPAPVVLLAATRSGDDSASAVVAQLAATLVRDGLRVTIVDADRARPRLNRVFGKPDAPGLANVLAGSVRARDVLHVGAGGSLRFLAAGEADGGAAPATERGLRAVFADLREDTDLLLVNGPSVFSVPAIAPLQRASDGVVLVTAPNAPPAESVARARRLLTNGYQPHIVGVVVGETGTAFDADETAQEIRG